MNKVFLAGYLAQEPETNTSQHSGVLFSRSVVAVSENLPSKTATQYVEFVGFGSTANFMKNYLHKGDFVVIDGRLSRSKRVNKEGQTTYSTSIIVNQITSSTRRNDGVMPMVESQRVFNDAFFQSQSTKSISNDAVFDNEKYAKNNQVKSSVTMDDSAHTPKEEEPFETSTYRVDNHLDEQEDSEITWSEDME